ncbi:hypothetical protein DH2020_020976 [Rehmannia glutinosa]|uniref:CCHC-type domain-containing protein n=1 Tax=Rehmannia glutinosa TaxID=99300 RepID=A0ABR0W922_REHGL
MGKREKKVKAKGLSSSEEDKRKRKAPTEAAASDDDAEANEDLSLKIVQKSMQRTVSNDPRDNGVSEIVTDLKEEKKKKEKKKRKKSKEIEAPEDSVPNDIDTGFREFCGELFLVDNAKDKEKPVTDKTTAISTEAGETDPAEVPDNVVLRKLLRGPRYFDPPDSSWGACYNCGEEGHTTVNCTSARRKKPCFVCGSFEHNAKQCSKGRDCYICKQQGHRAKDCPEKYKSSKICLKCGDLGHEMFSCRNDYSPDDIKEIQCYICGRFGHLCCINYSDPGPTEVSCYRCGQSGHTGLACMGFRGDTNDDMYVASSCYRCGVAGHFARECTTPMKAGKSKRNHEPSTPKHKSSKKHKDRMEPYSAPHDFGKTRKKKKSQFVESAPPAKTKHRHGWTTEHPEDYNYSNNTYANNWRSPSNSSYKGDRFANSYGDYASSSHSSQKPHKLNYNYSPSYGGSSRSYQHNRYSASRFGNDSRGRNDNYW